MDGKKYYWLKLKKDFFKRHDIRIIEGMPDGIQISHFYLKLMLESVDHDGELRFSEDIPYTPEMLAIITDTDKEIVKKALDVLSKFNLLVIDECQTIKLPKVSSMVGFETDWAKKKRQYRDKQETEQGQSEDIVRTLSDKSKSKSKSIEIELDSKENIQKKKPFVPPTIDEVDAYCHERNNNVNAKKFVEYYEAGGWKDAKGKPVKNWKQKIITWEKYAGSKVSNNRSGGNEFTALLEQMEDAE